MIPTNPLETFQSSKCQPACKPIQYVDRTRFVTLSRLSILAVQSLGLPVSKQVFNGPAVKPVNLYLSPEEFQHPL